MRVALRFPARLGALVLVTALLPTQGCVLEWIDYVTKLTQLASAGDEYRVRDLRVLAMEAEPAELRYPLSFLDEDASGEPLTLRARAFAYDPRGGEVQASFSVCVRSADDFNFVPLIDDLGEHTCVDVSEALSTDPSVARSLQPVERTVTAGPARGGGRLSDLDYQLHFDGEAVRGLAGKVRSALPELDPANVGRFQLLLVLRVSRVWLGTPEDEWAVLPLEARPALRDADPDEVATFLEENGAELCDPDSPRECVDPRYGGDPGYDPSQRDEVGGECGDGRTQVGEECDAPEEGWCTDECTIKVCETICAVDGPALEPRLFGVDVVEDGGLFGEARLSPTDDAELHDGDVVPLRPGERMWLQAVVRVDEGEELPEEDWRETGLRWYVFGDGSIVAPTDAFGSFSQGAIGSVEYASSAEAHQAGDREPLVIVAGGRAQRVLTLELAFESLR